MGKNSITELRKMLLVINPVSGRKASTRYLTDILRIFSANGWAVTVFITEKPCDAEEYVRLYAEGFDSVVCIGGDGTFNEVICGLVESGLDIPLGLIPAGSTNVFADCHKISTDILTAAQSIAAGNIKEIDVGDFGGKSFSFIASFGMFSWLSYTTPQNMKNVLGHSAYILDAFKDLPKLKSEHLKFITDNYTYEGDYIFAAICNTDTVAGTFTLPKDTVNTGDSMFEVLLLHKPHSVMDFQSQLNGVFTHDYSSAFIDFFQTDFLSIEAPDGLEWAVDGERYIARSPIKVYNLHKRLKLLH